MRAAYIHYDLTLDANGYSLGFELPRRKFPSLGDDAQFFPVRCGQRDPIYDEVERDLESGWLVGVDVSRRWNSVWHPFYIDDHGELIFNPHLSSRNCWYGKGILRVYRQAIAQRQGHNPAKTQRNQCNDAGSPLLPSGQTLNGRNVGRLLAAGGIYNGNTAGFRQTAQQLGGEAINGYDSLLNETTSGVLVAAASLLALRRPLGTEELTHFQGKYKKTHVLMDDMKVSELIYLRRDRADYIALRKQFDNTARPGFLKSIATHPDALSTFDSDGLVRLTKGKVPDGWQVHHKIPIDDGGTNAFDNLVLIKSTPYHASLSRAQASITKDLPYNASKNVLWSSPDGVFIRSGNKEY